MKGRDGNMWVVKVDKIGRPSWKPYKKTGPGVNRPKAVVKKTKLSTTKKFSVLTRYPKKSDRYMGGLSKSEINLAKQFGVEVVLAQIEDGLLDGYVKATKKSDVQNWLREIGAKPILQFSEV